MGNRSAEPGNADHSESALRQRQSRERLADANASTRPGTVTVSELQQRSR